MSDQTKEQSDAIDGPRTFLCVVDESPELSQALRYACNRAKRVGGRVALLYVIEPAEFEHWASVKTLMQEERRSEAEEMLKVVASVVQKTTGSMPVIYIREGKITEEIIKLLDEEEAHISVLVLGAATGAEGPGPIVSLLINKMAGKLRLPVTVVPGGLSDAQIDSIT